MYKYVQRKWGVVRHDSWNICVVKKIFILQKIKTKKKSSLHLGHSLYFLGSKQQVFKVESEHGENKIHNGVFGPGTQSELKLEQPKLLAYSPTEAKLMRIN